jgi:hypothetical protein
MRDRRGDRKTPAPRPAPAAGPTRQLSHRRRQPGPAVCHLDPHGTDIHPHADLNGSATVLDRIREQVVEGLGEPQPVAMDNGRTPRPRCADIDPAASCIGRGAPRLRAVGEQRAKVHVLKAKLCRTAAGR